MNQVLEKIITTGIVKDEEGNQFELHSHTSLQLGLFLQQILQEIRPLRGVEVGLAYGVSSLFILDKMQELQKGKYKHTIVEPFPAAWQFIGTKNIEKAGFADSVNIEYKLSDKVLPEMHLKNERIQFAFVDSTKLFDVIFHDFYFIDKILDKGGVIVFDDCSFPGIRKVVRFIANHPSYKIFKAYDKDFKTKKFRVAEKFTTTLMKLIPFKKKVFLVNSFETDEALGVDYFSIAFQKIKDDERSYYWNKNF